MLFLAIVSSLWIETFKTRAQPSFSTCLTSTGRTTPTPATGELAYSTNGMQSLVSVLLHNLQLRVQVKYFDKSTVYTYFAI